MSVSLMSIPLEAIHEDPNKIVRRRPTRPAAAAAMAASVQAQGVLQPILVRTAADGYVIIEGRRRIAAASAAGLTEIPALVRDELVNGRATAAQAAANMVREPMHPLDEWQAVVQLQADGYTLPEAAMALGLSERYARQLDKLGRLHPDVLALIEAHGMPKEHYLSTIAMASPDQQRKAVKAKDAVYKHHDGTKVVQWHYVAQALKTVRFSRKDAIFDLEKVKIAWDEDLFAQPDDDDRFTTTDAKTFLIQQRRALEAQVVERMARKERVHLADYDDSKGLLLPAGWKRTYRDGKPKADEAIFVAVRPDGVVTQEIAVNVNAQKEREKARQAKERDKAKAQRQAAKSGAPATTNAAADEADDAGDDEADAPIATAPKPPITKAGLAAIAAAKTEALRAHLRAEETAQRSAEDMLRLMILVLGCRNIQVQSDGIGYGARHFQDLAERLLLPGGQIDPHTMPILPGIAAEAIARIVGFSGDGLGMRDSGPAAEWIGAAIGADEALPRFDTAEFLAHVNGDELRRAATEAGIKPLSKVSGLREQLVGKLPNWKPAAFGAPAPVVKKEDR